MARLRAALLPLLLTTVLLAGCTGGDGTGATTTVTKQTVLVDTVTVTQTGTVAPAPAATLADPCPLSTPTSTVPGFTVRAGNWSRASADSVLCGEGTVALNSLTLDGINLTNLEASVAFRMVNRSEAEFDAGAGMVIHYANATDYQIIRYSPREQGWHLFTMANGVRTKQDAASVTPPTTNPEFAEWVHLTVRSVNGTITAFDGTTKVIEYVLPAGNSTTGTVGYFLRAQQAAQFEALTARAL